MEIGSERKQDDMHDAAPKKTWHAPQLILQTGEDGDKAFDMADAELMFLFAS